MADYNLNGEPNEEQTKWEGERLADATTAPVLEEQETAVEPVVETQSQPVETAPVVEAPAQPERTPLTKEDIARRYGTFTDDEVDAMSEDEYGNLLKEAERRGDYESESTKARKRLTSRLETAEQLARMTDFIIDETEGEEDHKADHDFAVKARDFLRNDTSLFTGLDDRRAQIVANDIMKRHKEASERRGIFSVFMDSLKRGHNDFMQMLYAGWQNITTDMTGEDMETVQALRKHTETENLAAPKQGKSLKDAKSFGDYLTIGVEGFGENIEGIAVGALAATAGAMTGGLAGSVVLGSAGTMLRNTGEAVGDQLEEMEKDPSIKYSRILANAQGGAYSVLDGAFGIQAGMGKLWAKGLKAIGVEAVKEGKVKAIEEIAKMATVKGALGEWFKGMVEEGIQEPLQSQVFGRLRRYLQTGSFLRKGESEADAWWETADEAFGGASTAAFLGFLGAGSSHVNANRIQRVYDNIDAALNNDKTYQALDSKTRMLVKQRVANDSYLEVAGLFSEDARERVKELSADIDKELMRMSKAKGDSKAAQNERMQGASAMAYLNIFKSRFASEDFDSVVNSEEGQAIAANITPDERRAQHEEMRNSETRVETKDGGHILVYTNPATQIQVAHIFDKDGNDLGWGTTNTANRKEPLGSANFASLDEALDYADKLNVYNQVRDQRQSAKKAVIKKVFREIYGNRSPQLVFVDRPDATVDTRDALPAGAKAEYTASDNTVRISTDAIENLGQLYTILTHERTHADIAEFVKDQIVKDGLAKSADDVTAEQIQAMKEKYFGLDENENEKVKGSKASYEANKGKNAWGKSVAETGEELLAERNSIIALRNAVVSTEKNALSALADRIRSAVGMKMASDMRLDARAIMQSDVLEEMKYLMDNDYLGKEVEVQPGARTAQLKTPMTLDEQVRQYVAESEGRSEDQTTETATQTTAETATQTATETATAEAPQETSGNAPVSAPAETATTTHTEETKPAEAVSKAKKKEESKAVVFKTETTDPKPSAKPKSVKGTADDIKPIDPSMKRGAKGTGAEILAEVKRVLTDPRHNAQTLGDAISDAEAVLKQKKNALRLSKSQRSEIENLIDDADVQITRIKHENRENVGRRNRARALERRGLKNRKQVREMLKWAVENGAIVPGSYLSYIVGENGSFNGIMNNVPRVTWKKDPQGNVRVVWKEGSDIESVVPASTFMTVAVGKDGGAKYAPSDSLEAWQMGHMVFGMSPRAIVDAALDDEQDHSGLEGLQEAIQQEMTPEQAEAFNGSKDLTEVLQDTISQYEDAEKAFDRQAKREEEQARAFVEQQEAEDRENREEREAMGADNEERAAAEVKFAEDDAYGYGKLVNDVNHFNSMMMLQADEEQMKEAWDRLDSNGKALAYLHLRTELDPEGFYGLVSDDEIRMFKSAAEDVAMGKAAFDGDQDAFTAIWAALTTRDLGIRSEDIDELNANDDRNTQTGSRDNYAHYGLLEKYISALFGRAYSNPGAVGEVQSRVLMRMMADLNSKGKSNYEAKKAYWSKASPIQIAFKYANDEKNSYVRQLMGGGGHEKKTDVAVLNAKISDAANSAELLDFKRSGDAAVPASMNYIREESELIDAGRVAAQNLEELVFPYLSEDKQELLRDYLNNEKVGFLGDRNERRAKALEHYKKRSTVFTKFEAAAIADGVPKSEIKDAFINSQMFKTGSNEWRFRSEFVAKVAKQHNIPAGVAHYELCEIFDNLRAVLTGKIYRVGERRHSWRNITPKERQDKAYWLLHRQFGKDYSNNELVTMMFIDAENGYPVAKNIFEFVQYAMDGASNEQIAKAMNTDRQTVVRALRQAESAYGWRDERGSSEELLSESELSRIESREYKEDDRWTPTKGGALFKEVQRLLHKGLSKDAIVKRLVDGKKASEAEAKRIVASADEKVGNGLFDAMGLEFDMGDTRPERDKFADIKKLLSGGASEESVMKKATTDFSLDEKTARKLVDRAKSEIKAHKDLIAEKRRAREKAAGVVQSPVLAPSITRKATEEEMAEYEAAKKGSEKSTYAKIRESADEAVKSGQSEESFVTQMANTYKGFNRDLITKAYQQAVKDSTVSEEERAIMREREAGSVGAEARAILRDTEFHSYVDRHDEAWENQIDGFVDPDNLSRRAEGKPEINKVNLLRNVHTIATLASHFGEKEPVRWTWDGSKAAYRGIAYGKAEKELKRLGWGTRKINEAIRYWQSFGFPMAKDAAELTKMEKNEAKDRSVRGEPELFKKESVGSAGVFDFTGMADSAADYLLKSEQAKQKAGKESSLDLFGGMFKSDAETVRGGTENGIMSANGNRTNTQVRFLDRNRVRADLDSLLSAEGVRRFTDPSGVASWSCPIETAKQAYVKFNSDPEAAKLFNAVYPVAKKLAVEVVFDDRTSVTESAHSLNDQVVYHLGNLGLSSRQRAADVMLHELIHSVVEYARQPAKYAKFKNGATVNGTRINDRLVEASNELQKLWRSNFVRLLANGKYAAKDSGELIAELSNRNTREILKKDGVFTRIVKALARLLNVANEWANGGRSDYDKLVGILGKFLDNYDTVLMDEVAAGEYDLKAKSATSGICTGSAADYEKPSLLKVGTGEGSQVYGWGLYASNVRDIAEGYANSERIKNANNNTNKIYAEVDKILRKKVKSQKQIDDIYEALYTTERWDDVKTNLIEGSFDEGSFDVFIKHEKEFKKIHDELVAHRNLYEQTFFMNRAPGDESHLLKWYEPVSEENKKRVVVALKSAITDKFGLKSYSGFNTDDVAKIIGDAKSGQDLYERVSTCLMFTEEGDSSQKAESEFLARADIDGIKYPVDSYGKTVKDGDKAGWNYVSFRDDNIRVDHKWVNGEQLFKSNAEDIRVANAADASVIFGARASQATHDLAFDKVVVRSGVKDEDLDRMAERKLRDKTEVNRLVERALSHEPLDEVGIRTLILHERDQLAGLYAANEAGRTEEAQAIEESVDRIAMAVQRSLAHTGAMLRQARRGASLDSMRDLKVWLVGEAKRRMAKQGVKGDVPAEMMKRIEEQAKALEGKNKEIAEALKRIAELEDKSRKMANDLEVERKKKAYSPFVASEEAKAAFKSKYEGLGAKVNERSIDAVNAISSLLGRGRMFAGNPTVELTDEMREAFSQLVYDFGMDFAKAAKGVHDLFDGSADSLFAKFRSEMEKTPSPNGSSKKKSEAIKIIVNRRRESFDKRVPKYESPTDKKSGLETARKRLAKERANTIQMMDDFAASFDERRRVLGEYLRNFLSSLVATNPTLTTEEFLLAMADEANALDTENTYTADDMMSVNLGEDGFDIADRSTAAQRLTKLRRALEAAKKGSVREASKLSGIGYQSDAEVLEDMRLDLENRIHALANEMTTVIGRPEGEDRAKKIAEEIGKLHAEIEELRADKPTKDKLDAWSARHGKRLRTAEERMLATLQRQIDELSRRIRENDFQPKPAKPRTNLSGITSKVAAKTRERDEMRRKFKAERERYEYRKLNALQRLGRDTFDILGEIKAVAGSLDLSSILRQGGQLTWAHPLLFSKNFVDTLKTFLSEDRAKAIMEEIRSRPNEKFYEKAGIEFTDWGQDAQNADDRFLLNHFRKITKNKLIARGVEMSERAFSMYLNMMRADVFDRMVASSTYGSADKMTDQQLRAIGNYINIASQRGAIDRSTAFGKAIPMLNTVLWSPRNIASRYQFLWNTAKLVTPGANPYGDKTLRKLFAMETARYLGGVAVAIAFAKMIADLMRGDDEPPEDLVKDPRSSDFLNVKFGNTRVDFLSGLKQIIVFQSRLFTGEKMNSRGEVVQTNIYETLGRFLRTKFSPGMSVFSDFYTGETFDNQDLDWTSVWGKDNETISPYRHVFEQVAPLTLFDIHEQWKQSGVKKSVLTWMLTILGAGVQAYDPYTYKQMSGDYKYFRRLYREAVEGGDEAEAKRILEYHPMLNRMGSIDAAVKRINKMKRDLKKMEDGGYSKESIAQVKDELERDTKLAINLMMNFKNPGQIE